MSLQSKPAFLQTSSISTVGSVDFFRARVSPKPRWNPDPNERPSELRFSGADGNINQVCCKFHFAVSFIQQIFIELLLGTRHWIQYHGSSHLSSSSGTWCKYLPHFPKTEFCLNILSKSQSVWDSLSSTTFHCEPQSVWNSSHIYQASTDTTSWTKVSPISSCVRQPTPLLLPPARTPLVTFHWPAPTLDYLDRELAYSTHLINMICSIEMARW